MNTVTLFNPNFMFDAFDKDVFDFLPALSATQSVRKGFVPSVDVLETKENYTMDMDLPGMSEDDVEISLKERTLCIASKKAQTEEKQKEEKTDAGTYLIKERTSRSFMRRFSLPSDSDAQNISAEFKNGVLRITVPRTAPQGTRTIAINKAS